MMPPDSEVRADLASLKADVRNLAEIVNEMRLESKEWREKQLQLFAQLAADRKDTEALAARLAAVAAAVRANSADIGSLKNWRWYVCGIAAAAAFILEKFLTAN